MGFMQYNIEKGSGAMIYISSFMKIGSGIQKLIGVIYRQTASDHICVLIFFFQNKGNGLMRKQEIW
jgi:hypothetical protein